MPQGKTETPTCRFPAPPVTTALWDADAWDKYLLAHCICATHKALRETSGVRRRDMLGRPLDEVDTHPNREEQLAAARVLPSSELRRHAAVARMEGLTRMGDSGKRCGVCFCCAAEAVLKERGEQPAPEEE